MRQRVFLNLTFSDLKVHRSVKWLLSVQICFILLKSMSF